MKRFCLASLVWLSSAACIAEEACEPAVDLADSLNVNARQDCDYEKSGLNRLVHKIFNESEVNSSSRAMASEAAGAALQISPPVTNARELAEVRYKLLQDIAQKCSKGFRLTDEQYLPSNGYLRINLHYECL